MKLKYVDYYEKGVSRLVNGVPVVVDGKVVRDVKPMYLYAVVDATPEEITLYKRFKRDNPDGKDYYRESVNGIPLWHSSEFEGFDADISSYKDKEGKVQFRINKALRGALQGMRKANPTLGDKIDDALWALLGTGTAADLSKLGSSIAEDTSKEDKLVETDNSGEVEGSDVPFDTDIPESTE